MDFFAQVYRCLQLEDPDEKRHATMALAAASKVEEVAFGDEPPAQPEVRCGRPPRPLLVSPGNVPRRRLGSPEGLAALVHAITHIEFNAINLALDAAYRFRGMPRAYYADWISVASDEARHFSMLSGRLSQLGYSYGDFPAHNGLWEMAEKTGHDCLTRMALVPRVLEARGLDVTPGMIRKLQSADDSKTCEILRVILAEEVGHVAIGTRWFRYCCAEQGKEPETEFLELLQRYYGRMRGPFNLDARQSAGFTATEMEALLASTQSE